MKFSTTRLILLAFMYFCTNLGSNAQEVYQLPNPGFETWEKGVKMDGAATKTDEPVGWNSFKTADSAPMNIIFAPFATKGNKGIADNPNYYVSVKSKEVAKIIANGVVSTGLIKAPETDASSTKNYNYTPVKATDTGADNFRQRFTGYPDAIKVLIQYIPGIAIPTEAHVAQLIAWIHNDVADFQDPYETETGINDKIVAKALLTPSGTEAKDDWKEYIIPFDYSIGKEGNIPAYILITASTNQAPGGGSKNDELRIDDLYMVYYSSLSDIKINGTTIEGFDVDKTTYEFVGNAPELTDIEVVVKGRGASFEMPVAKMLKNGSTSIAITVKGNDFETSGNQTVYNLSYTPDPKTGIDQNTGNNENVYVVNGQVHIEKHQGLVDVYDLKGIKVYTQMVENNAIIDIPNGTYVVRTAQKSVTLIVK